MNRIQICDLDHSNSEFLYELTDPELFDINGGGLFKKIFGSLLVVAGVIVSATGLGSPVGVSLIGGGTAIIASDPV